MLDLVDITDQPAIALWGDAVRAQRIEGEQVTLALVELDPGAELPEHTHDAEQLGIVIRGSLTFEIEGERRELGPGGAWRVASRRPHRATAGPEGATAIDVFSPRRHDWDALPRAAGGATRWPVEAADSEAAARTVG